MKHTSFVMDIMRRKTILLQIYLESCFVPFEIFFSVSRTDRERGWRTLYFFILHGGGYNNLKAVDCTEIGPAALCEEGGYVRPIQCLAGQLVQVDGQFKLYKTKKECNEVLEFFICRSETHNKHTDLDISVSLSPSTKKNTIIIKTENISNTIHMYTSETSRVIGSSELTNDQRDPTKKGNSSNIIGAVIGGVLGACSMIAVVSVLIVCKIRSNGIFTKSNNHIYEDTGQVISSKTVYEDISNTRIKITTTAATQTCDLSHLSPPVYDNINESK